MFQNLQESISEDFPYRSKILFILAVLEQIIYGYMILTLFFYSRMVLNEASLCTGMMIGNVVSGYLYAATNTVTVFAISSGLMLLALIYVVIFVIESLRPDQIHSGVSNYIYNHHYTS